MTHHLTCIRNADKAGFVHLAAALRVLFLAFHGIAAPGPAELAALFPNLTNPTPARQ